MDFKSKQLQLQYEGYSKTPSLWQGALFGLKQFELDSTPLSKFSEAIPTPLRLGKRVERFVSHDLKHQESIQILKENIQVFEHKQTLGELDLLLLKNEKPFHIEIVYKFYVYDPTVGHSELDHWIGPNRKDSLVQKLSKLKEKQLPLLYRHQTETVLKNLGLYSQNIEQAVVFKAQLFVPLTPIGEKLPQINNDCIIGYYMGLKEIDAYKDCKFYIPDKVDWLIEVQKNVDWLELNSFKTKLEHLFLNFTSTLCWIKHSTGVIDKCFVTWWE